MNLTTAFSEFKELKNQAREAGVPVELTLDEFIAWYQDHGIDINDAASNINRKVMISRKDESLPFMIDNLILQERKPINHNVHVKELSQKEYINPNTITDLTKPALIIGNGKSRLKINLNDIKHKFNTYGSNAIYRDFTPDIITALDPGIIQELLDNKVYNTSQMFIRHEPIRTAHISNNKLPIRIIEFPGKYLDSGNTNVYLSTKHDNTNKIYLIGFDYISDDSSLNNVYAGTKNYSSGKHIEPYLINKWVSRLQHICNISPTKQIIRVKMNDFTPNIKASNFNEISFEQFKEQINEL